MRAAHVIPLVLVAHGSPDSRSRAAVREIAAVADARATFLDFDAPHPVDELTALADAGHRRVRLVPLLLTHAHHGRVDIPRVAAAATDRRSALSVEVTDPIGGAHLLPALHRALRTATDASTSAGFDAVVFAAAGTRDPGTVTELRELARLLGDRCGVPAVAGFASAARPNVAEAVQRLRDAGARRVAVASYFVAPGVLHDRIADAARDAGAVAVTAPLGACAELVAAIRRRYSSPTAWRLDGNSSSTPTPTPTTQATTANSHSPALAR